MIAGLLPAGARTAYAVDAVPTATLFPEEEDFIAGAADRRRRTFTTVRHCARQALAALGHPACPLVPGVRGAPVWPAGVAGSMTHCAGYHAAAVASRTVAASLGIDAEPHGPLPEGVCEAVTSAGERRRLSALTRREPGVHWDRLLFSAKESVYKAWFPLTGTWLGWTDAVVEIAPDTAEFRVRPGPELDAPGRQLLRALRGRWLVRDGLVLTAAAHPPVRGTGGGQPWCYLPARPAARM
ncbi:4'-phosphopantetheinyl transferase family protein [Streptomyces sp. TE33382]